MLRLKKNVFNIKFLLPLILGVAVGFNYHDEINFYVLQHIDSSFYDTSKSSGNSYQRDKNHNAPASGQVRQVQHAPKIDLCFTPPANCASRIVNVLNRAKSNIYIQAYGLTHPQILDALINAKNRGIEVKLLLDKSNLHQRYSGFSKLREAGIETTIDVVQGIAHNKVIIIDEHVTVTGSFNFTKSADTRNAENVLIIEDENIAEKYLKNWLYRKSLNNKVG